MGVGDDVRGRMDYAAASGLAAVPLAVLHVRIPEHET